MDNRLPHPPLQEVIFELKWRLDPIQPGIFKDPHYQILFGSLYGKLREIGYSEHEPLPTANIPDEMTPFIVQHRFRLSKGKWPLIQIGPGIITLNDTTHYSWPDFSHRIKELLEKFFNIYPNLDSFQVIEINIRYIDAVTIPEGIDDPKDFLRKSMNADIIIPESLFTNTGVFNKPLGFDLSLTFPREENGSVVLIRYIYGHGTPKGKFTWETMVHIEGETTPQKIDPIMLWCENAHNLTHKWFLEMCSDELMESFK